MKRTIALLGVVLFANSGCSTMNNTEAGALGGGVFGGILGTVVGAATGHAAAGAAIGAASGALVGGAVGNSEDRREKREVQAAQQWSARNQMTINDVVSMTQQHIDDSLIVNQMNTTYSNFEIRAEDITYLKQQGVSDRVIAAMQARRAPPPGGYRAVPASNVVIYEAPPRPVSIGFGYGYGGYYGRRGWW